MWVWLVLMALALLPTAKNTLSGVCLSFPVAGTASIIRAVKTVQSVTIATELRINMFERKRIIRELAARRPHGKWATVYTLVNYDTTLEEDLYRIYTLRDLGYDPYVMVYDKPNAPWEARKLQRWCNNRKIFRAEPDFKKYDPKGGQHG